MYLPSNDSKKESKGHETAAMTFFTERRSDSFDVLFNALDHERWRCILYCPDYFRTRLNLRIILDREDELPHSLT